MLLILFSLLNLIKGIEFDQYFTCFKSFFLVTVVCVYMLVMMLSGGHASGRSMNSPRTALCGQASLSTLMWLLGIELRCPACVAIAVTP